jgi:hypothetical protein
MATSEVSPENSAPVVVLSPNDPMIFQVPSTSSEEDSPPMLTSRKVLIPRRSESVSASTTEPPKIGQKRSLSQAEFKNLPRFTANVPEGTLLPAPSPRIPSSPSPKNDMIKRISRPNSPSNVGRIVLPRSRLANIRRESDCSVETEVAHERYIKTAVQVSVGFEDFSLDDKAEDRRRAKSFTDPISITILGSSFISTSSQSPTRVNVDQTKQCYSPATQQLVRSNISYSPSPSPTPSSPKRSKMRSMSPIVSRQISKRRYTGSGNGSGLESDTEGPPLSSKRQCTSFSKSCGSPLVRDVPPTFYNPNAPLSYASDSSFNEPTQRSSSPTPSESSTTSSVTSFSKPRTGNDQVLNLSNSATCIGDSDDCVNDDQEVQYTQKDDQSSTTFSSRACTPTDECESRMPDEVSVQSTTPTGLIRTFTAGSSSPFRFTLPPSPLASQRMRDASDF